MRRRHSYSLLPTPYSLLPTPYSLLPTPCSLKPRTLDFTKYKNAIRYNTFTTISKLLPIQDSIIGKVTIVATNTNNFSTVDTV
ncbi:hypothetical protein [Moorena producens]|uniref:hypothetical protein n=1 Tax=Moorena producens TaxID=1155739 RepID=UPI00131412BC|nr:hypothetical protein [Moorena producens]